MNNAIDQNEVYDDSANLSFLDYIQILKFHWKKIIFITVITLFLATYQTFTVYPKYAANASIMIKEKPGANMIMDVSGKHLQNRLKNEMQLIKSRAVAKEVVRSLYESDKRNNLHILGTRKFYPKGWRLRVFFKELFSLGFYEQEKDQPITFENPYTSEIGERFAGQILKNLTVKSSISTDNNLSYTSVNADEARKILNKLIKVYIELDLKWGSEDAVQSVRFLENLIQTQEGELYNAEEKIRDFKKVNKIYDLQGNAGSFSSEFLSIETEIYNISAEINIRTEKRQILKSKLSNDEQLLADQLTNNINNQLLALREEISKLESNLFQNILSYGKIIQP